MKASALIDFVLLAALWGASFLFMRLGAPEFGPVALIGMRVLLAAVCLWPLLWWRQATAVSAMKTHAIPLTVVGVSNSALPFTLLAYASLSLTAGFNALINATTPLWAALIGFLWLRNVLSPLQRLGLPLGVVGIVFLTWGKVDFKPGGSGFAVIAGLIATLSYGFATHYTKRALADLPALGIATGSQTAAALLMLPFTVAYWPSVSPSQNAWIALLLLAGLSTALAYVLYFRLIARLGGQTASTVTFLIPVFAALWGWTFLNETVTLAMVIGGGTVLAATALMLWKR